MTPQYAPLHIDLARKYAAGKARMQAAARKVATEPEPIKFVPKLVPKAAPAPVVQVPVARDILYIATPPDIPDRYCLTKIIREVAGKHGVTEMDIKSQRRQSDLVGARQEYYWRARHETTKSYPQIAKFCGGRDHTTALHGVRKHQWRLDNGLLRRAPISSPAAMCAEIQG